MHLYNHATFRIPLTSFNFNVHRRRKPKNNLNTLYNNIAANQTTGFKNWRQTTGSKCSEKLLQAPHTDSEDPEGRGHAPDLLEGNEGKLAPPEKGYNQTTQYGHRLVAKVLAAVETRIAALPHTVHAVGTVRLAQNVLKGHL